METGFSCKFLLISGFCFQRGFFCPIFWGSVIMGAPASVILFNLTHSGIIIALGALIALLNYVKYRRA